MIGEIIELNKCDGIVKKHRTITDIYCTNTKSYIENDFDFYRDPCKKVSKYLNHLEGIHEPFSMPKASKYLNYWLYEKNIMNRNNDNTTLLLYEIIRKVYMDDAYLYKDVCEHYIEQITKDIFTNFKEHYEE
ncbi:PIR Superfamily Protein [Plasmodium ovale wallikeri]|uniref:PIR Superfamily Protein n=1 Tax=Plasmodium ovale wallikeri TaxID=864142 RepID=A0A1A9AQV9_PLAOA|nr:PIR Superfamily Protein [Plasmodium ovale wallikeri]